MSNQHFEQPYSSVPQTAGRVHLEEQLPQELIELNDINSLDFERTLLHDDEQGEGSDIQQGDSNMKMAFMNMANSILGAGIIGQPFAFKNAGLIDSVLLIDAAIVSDPFFELGDDVGLESEPESRMAVESSKSDEFGRKTGLIGFEKLFIGEVMSFKSLSVTNNEAASFVEVPQTAGLDFVDLIILHWKMVWWKKVKFKYTGTINIGHEIFF
ncbi:hypothetical protein QCA50_019211 [Cerrena zonata]|uniref:Amino acid transporter transmembrane domain-containing protein n=1 Tax=Cerrena zonata TaxID=2478898 RepID=A0AAW0FFU4_9APHY